MVKLFSFVFLSYIVLVTAAISVRKGESGKLIFSAVNSTYLKVEWDHLVEGDLEDVKKAILYKVSPDGYKNLGSVTFPFGQNTSIFVKHNACLGLRQIFARIIPKDKSNKDYFDSQETSYSPPLFLQVRF